LSTLSRKRKQTQLIKNRKEKQKTGKRGQEILVKGGEKYW
jgi:hypothetical protein